MKNAAASSEDPAKSPAYKAVEPLIARAWDAWIWASADLRHVFMMPPSPADADLAAAVGLQLAKSSEGLALLHKGHAVEET